MNEFSGTATCFSPQVAVVMGSKSDWETMKEAVSILDSFSIRSENKVLSAHRMPDAMFDYAKSASKNKLRIIIAGAGGAAHLPGMIASLTTVPVLGVPIQSQILFGVDSMLSILQMPAGIPVATFAIGVAGAKNAALFAVSMLALDNFDLHKRLNEFRSSQTAIASESLLEKD